MEELTSKSLIEAGLLELKAISLVNRFEFGNYKDTYTEYDFVKIETSEGDFQLKYDLSELDGEDGEIKQITHIEDGRTYTDTTISFVLSDKKSKFKLPFDKTVNINLAGNINVKLSKDKQAVGVLLGNLSKVIDVKKCIANENNTIDEIISDDIVVIVIESTSTEELNNLELNGLIDSLKLQMIYHNNITLSEIEIDKVINNLDTSIELKENLSAKIYDDINPLKYFLFAETVEYNHLKYLEYYHVLEYYFLHKRMKDLDTVVKDLLYLELSNQINKNEENHYYKSLVKVFDIYFKQEDKNISEQEQLEYILKEDIGYRNLAQALNGLTNLNFLSNQACEISKTAIGVLKKNDELFKTGSKPRLLDCDNKDLTDLFCEQLANRIYKVRNFIVHSKKYERFKVFTPTIENLDLLKDEVSLIRAISYVILNRN
ncbi:hypothetical protein C518_2995 [Lysinibacillus fusiformis ZB2]|nr:hypothetical protein C518_2995 [Lysinibacillus fusiformis ZB2]